MPDPTVKKLRKAIDGLVFMSEKDAPFEAFEWDAEGTLTPKLVRELGGHPKKEAVSETDFHEFFDALTQEQDWHGEEEKEQVRKYRDLLATFEKEVTDPTIYRVGKINARYYIVGRSQAGHWVGVKTEAVET
jgi:hypothetical protein